MFPFLGFCSRWIFISLSICHRQWSDDLYRSRYIPDQKSFITFFKDWEVSITMILMLLGTNYFHEAGSDGTMPHAMLFAGYAWILWLTIKWHERPNTKTMCWLGFALGFMILLRGSEIVALSIPMLWNVWNKESWVNKWRLIWDNRVQLLLGISCFMIVPMIQMLYWKYVTGQFIFFSYQNTEGFDWDGRHILKVLFSYKKVGSCIHQ